MKGPKKLNKEINRIQILRDCGFDCQLELDRLYTKRDNAQKKEKEGNDK